MLSEVILTRQLSALLVAIQGQPVTKTDGQGNQTNAGTGWKVVTILYIMSAVTLKTLLLHPDTNNLEIITHEKCICDVKQIVTLDEHVEI